MRQGAVIRRTKQFYVDCKIRNDTFWLFLYVAILLLPVFMDNAETKKTKVKLMITRSLKYTNNIIILKGLKAGLQ